MTDAPFVFESQEEFDRFVERLPDGIVIVKGVTWRGDEDAAVALEGIAHSSVTNCLFTGMVEGRLMLDAVQPGRLVVGGKSDVAGMYGSAAVRVPIPEDGRYLVRGQGKA